MSDRPDRDERDLDAEFEAEFAAIVARWDDAPAVPLHEQPKGDAGPTDDEDDTGDLLERGDDPAADLAPTADPAHTPDAVDPDDPDREAPVSPVAPTLGSIPVWRGAQATPEERWEREAEEHYEPPPPRPLPPQEDLSFWGIIVGLVGGPLLLLWLVIFRPDVSNWWTFAALALTVAGFVLLVMRQPHSRDDDPDDGAVV